MFSPLTNQTINKYNFFFFLRKGDVRSEFLHLDIIGRLDWPLFCCGGCPVHCSTVSDSSGLYTLFASSNPLFQWLQQKFPQTLPNMPWGQSCQGLLQALQFHGWHTESICFCISILDIYTKFLEGRELFLSCSVDTQFSRHSLDFCCQQ